MIEVLEVGKSTGGVGEYMRWLAKGLDKNEFRLTFVCLSENGPELAAELGAINGVGALSMPMNRYKISPAGDARAAWRLRQVMKQGRYQVAHAHASKAGFLVRAAAAGSGLPVIYSPHMFAFGDDVPRLKARSLAAIESFMARWLTARVVTVSANERDVARRYGVGNDELFAVIPSGVELLAARPGYDRPAVRASLGVPVDACLVGVVGRLAPQKAPLDFVAAARIVLSRLPGTHFIWVGDGPLSGAVRDAVRQAGMEDRLHLAGQRSDVADILPALDCFVLPSRSEAMPISLLEAMSAGLPVVAALNDGTAEVIESEQDGLLTPFGDVSALANAIQRVLSEPGLAGRLAASGRSKIEREFTRAKMLARLSQVYRETARRSLAGA